MNTDVPLVMLVNNEPVMCDVMRRILQMNGYKVIVANDSAVAVELTKRFKPAIVVLDIGLSVNDKKELSADIRKTADCPIIYFTSMNTD